jgi:hypothetical protein
MEYSHEDLREQEAGKRDARMKPTARRPALLLATAVMAFDLIEQRQQLIAVGHRSDLRWQTQVQLIFEHIP